MTDSRKFGFWMKCYRWTIAFLLAFMAGAAVRLFFMFLNRLASQKTSFFDGGLGYLLTHYEVGRYLAFAISEGFAWAVFFAVLIEKAPTKSERVTNRVYLILISFFSFVIIWNLLDYNYYDSFGMLGGLFGASCLWLEQR